MFNQATQAVLSSGQQVAGAQGPTLHAATGGSGAQWLGDAGAVRRLAEQDFLRGARRPRFAYDPPEGWGGLVEAAGPTVWLCTDSSRGPVRLSVWPAIPRDDTPALVDELLADQRGWYEVNGPMPMSSREGLRGDLWEITVIRPDGSRRSCVLAVLRDEGYLYPVRLETYPDQRVRDMVDLFDLVHSVLPLTAPARF